jgi:hypothetical protein
MSYQSKKAIHMIQFTLYGRKGRGEGPELPLKYKGRVYPKLPFRHPLDHWVRELVSNNVLNIHNIRDSEQTADILTKALPKPKHSRHTEEMGIRSQ